MGSLIAIFCPDLRYLYHSSQAIDQTFVRARNFLDDNQEFAGVEIYTMSKETGYEGDLILVLNGARSSQKEVWRVEGVEDIFGNYSVRKTKIFEVLSFSDVQALEVYDDFTMVHFTDETVFLFFRPDVEGELAQNLGAVDPGDIRKQFLMFQDSPILYYAIVQDNSLTYDYIMNILSGDSGNADQYISQQGITVEKEEKRALFTEIKEPTLASSADQGAYITAIDSNSKITVIGFGTMNEGRGFLQVFDSQTAQGFETLVISGTEDQRALGKNVYI